MRNAAVIGPLLAVAGLMLGGCGGGDGTALTGTRPTVTATRPAATAVPTDPVRTAAPTLPARTETSPATTADTTIEVTTSEITTAPEPTTPTVTTTAPTVTVIEPVTVTEPETTTAEPTVPATTDTEPAPTPTTTAVAAEPTSTDGTPWGWILGVALAAALGIGFAIWRRRRAGADAWSAQLADLRGRCLVALDDVVSEGSVVTGQIQALAAEAQSLEARAPDDPSRTAATRLRGDLEELSDTLESDRALRLGSPPPSTEQIAYSTALIRRQVEQLQGGLRPPSAGRPPV